jgi:predicted DNA-binding transcriptional regulator AlpA
MSHHKKISEALSSFDQLPDSAHIRLTTLKALLGVSSATVWRMVKAKTLTSYHLTPRTTTFNVGQLRELLAKRGVK